MLQTTSQNLSTGKKNPQKIKTVIRSIELALIEKVAQIGTSDMKDRDLQQRVMFVNYMSLITALTVIFVGSILFYVLKSPRVGLPALGEGAMFLVAIWFNSRRRYNTAGLIMFFTHFVAAGFYGLVVGELLIIHLLMIFLIFCIPMVFSSNVKRNLCITAGISTVVFLQVCHYYGLFPSLIVERPRSFIADNLPLFGVLTLIYLVWNSYVRTRDYNGQLQQAKAELENVNRKLNEFNLELEKANQNKRRFLGGTLHDIRTYQNAISGGAQLLLRDGKIDAALDPYMDTIRDIFTACNGVSEELNDVLELESIEAGKQDEVKPETFRTIPFMRDILKVLSVTAFQRNITLKLVQENVPQIMQEDPLKLKKILMNLLSNAIKFADPGSMVCLRLTFSQSEWQSEVTNTGDDIDSKRIKKIFDAFVTHTSGYVEGTGLGLYLVKHKVGLLGGKLSVSSRCRTTSFTVRLPFHPGIESELRAAEEDARMDIGKHRILVIEDNPINVKQLQNFLQGWDCQVSCALDGFQGLEMAKKELPELIILDSQLPGKSGLEVLNELKCNEWLKNIPVIIASGVGFDQEDYLKAGADSYILKPVDYKILRANVARLLRPKSELAKLRD